MDDSISLPFDKRLNEFRKQVAQAKIDYCAMTVGDEIVFAHARKPNSADKLHKINSVTKSIVSLLVGLAIDRGLLESVQLPLSEFFPGLGQIERGITVEHLLTMTPGWDWPEWAEWNGFPKEMQDSPDWVRFVLSRPLVDKPGSIMKYNSGCSHLLSAILQQVTGMSTSEFAAIHLFKPLGISDYRWPSDVNGIDIGGFGLQLKALDLHKLGTLMLGEGRIGDRGIVSKAWIRQSMQPRFMTYPHVGAYGYHWWIMSDDEGRPTEPFTLFAMGFGGQFVLVVPEFEWVVSFASSLYKKSFLPMQLFKSLLNGVRKP